MSTAVTPLAPPGPRIPIVTVKSILAGEPPRQHVLFHMPPEGVWFYRVEYRLWQKFTDGREAWSEWYHAVSQTCLAWYKRECDAERALKRYRARYDRWTDATPREYRVTPLWAEQLPYRRDLDERRKNLNRMKRGLKTWKIDFEGGNHGF